MAKRAARLKVHYLIKGNLETDHHTAMNFRWKTDQEGVVHVFAHDAEDRTVWTKTYFQPVTVEMRHRKARRA